MAIFDFTCEHCGLEFDKLVNMDVEIATCPKCSGDSFKVFPRKAPGIELKFDPKTQMCDWDGNTSRYFDEYKKQKAEGKDVRIPALDGDD